MACWACCCIPCTKCCMCWKASIWKDTKQIWIRRYEGLVLRGFCGGTPPTKSLEIKPNCMQKIEAPRGFCPHTTNTLSSTVGWTTAISTVWGGARTMCCTQALSWRQWLKETGVESKSYLWTIIWLFCFHCFSIGFFFFFTFLITYCIKKGFVFPKADEESLLSLEHCLVCSGSITYITDRTTVT